MSNSTLALPDYRELSPEVAARFEKIEQRPVILKVRDLKKSFGTGDQEHVVFDHLNFDIHRREFITVIGPSGCGKSTFIRIAAGLDEATGGEMLLDDQPVRAPGPDRGMVFQGYTLFPWLTVEKNIGFGLTLRANRRSAAERREIVARYVALMGLQGFEKALPKTLSGGMRQRVALARAYATEPQVLLMDEPFAALDAQTREYLQELLAEATQTERRTTMLITHSVEEAIFLSHRVVVLGNRPTQVREVVDVPVPFPRTPESRLAPAFLEVRRHLEDLMRSLIPTSARS